MGVFFCLYMLCLTLWFVWLLVVAGQSASWKHSCGLHRMGDAIAPSPQGIFFVSLTIGLLADLNSCVVSPFHNFPCNHSDRECTHW